MDRLPAPNDANICLRFPWLSRQSPVTASGLEAYKVMIKDATVDLEDHLQSIDEKLESTFSRAAGESDEDAIQMRRMQEERSSTQQGLAICAQLSAHISRLQPQLAADGGRRSDDARAKSPVVAERITREGLEECQDTLSNTAHRLEKHLKAIMDRLMAKSITALSSSQDAADLERLQEEWETATALPGYLFQGERKRDQGKYQRL